ncbi:PBECR4 domain-containing protein [Streptococcus gallolyticus]|uniref:PBECR4 domain-containing protein n=1 Tax=Streptococcus gallolyticus TaxID=315405 RepID=UPI000210BC18|nr:PBECR4 domain-containing protein [Streptococcus gallolyticus]BAK29029.1 conserved hypothetical protein [Streptococcus gallolyticus subsp. gallolyticus ATCC 43143]
MPEKETRAKSRKERREVARSRAILDVANELNMDLFRSGRDYRWKEHHSLVISPDNNLWQWFSRHVGGDVISLVETIKEVNFNQAVDFLNDGDFKTFQRVERKEEPFNYYLKPYEQPFIEARNYLKHQRKLSDETIDFFLDQGVMAQANAKVHGSIEPVIVFKSLTQEGEIIGAQLQGIEANWKKWPERGYAKKIVNNSDGMTGLHVDIGQPKRLIFTESSIDLMSYYELHKDSLQDVRLVSMDGLKESIVGRHLVELEAELSGRPSRWSREELSRGLTTAIDNGYFAEGKHTDMITLAVDNDAGGRNFITSLQDKGVSLIVDIPDLPEGQEKADWNSQLQQENSDWLENNWDNITFSIERKEPSYTNQLIQEAKLAEHPYLVRLIGESRSINGQLFRQGETVRYEEFVTALYHTRQDYQSGDEENIIFDVLAPNGSSIVRNFHYHLPTDTKPVSELIHHEGLQAYEQATVNLLETMTDTQKEHLREFFKTRVSDVKTDYIYLPNGQENLGYYLDGYLFAHHYAELAMLSPSKQVDALMDRLASEDGEKMDQKFLEETFGYHLDTPIEEYHQSEKNSDRIAEKEEQDFRNQFDRQSFAETMELMQKYSPEEVLNESNSYHDEVRYQSLLIDLGKVDTNPMYRFIERYIDRDIDREALSQFSTQDFITIAKEHGLLNEEPSAEPWKAITVTQPVNGYTVSADNRSKEFDNISELYQFVEENLKRPQRQELSSLLSEPDRGTPLDILMAIDSAAGGDFNVEVNGQSILDLFPDGINEEATEIYSRSSAEIEGTTMGLSTVENGEEVEIPEIEKRSLSELQESLSNEGDLVATIASDNSVLYTNTVNFDQDYSLTLEVHSPEEVDNLSDIKASWTLKVIKDNHSLGYLAYGEDWGNDFNIEDDLVSLDSWITRNRVENHLYSQEEVNNFLEPLSAEKEAVGELKSYGTFIIDDDFLERRYGSEERDDNLTKAIDKAIKSITDSETYYLWHDEELDSLGASDQAFLEFHNSLQDIQYHKNGVNLFVAESSYDGATGFLSLEGNALDRDGIETYLFEKEWSPDETLDFLNNLKIAVDETWVKVIDHYNEQFDVVISRSGLSEDAKKSPENLQETMTSNSEQIKKNETILGDLSEQAQEAAPVPEVIKSQPLKELSPTQSESHSLLHFTIQKPDKSMYKRNYHIIDEEDLFKLNNNADIVQNSARWYLDNLADRTIHYFYQKEDRVYSVNLHFEERHYMHLTGIFPIKDGQTAEKTLHDFAAGRGDYDNIMISNRDATFQKIKALPDMKAILNANSFYFDNVDDIPKLHSLTMEQAIQSDDKDVLLAFQSNGENLYPASLMEVTQQLKQQLTNAKHANAILGVFSEKNGEITPLSINQHYVSDNGKEMLSILQNKQYQEISSERTSEPSQPEVTAEDFTHVLDAVYNNGAQIGKDNRDNIPEALHPAWDKYDEYATQHDNDFKQIMVAAEKDHLLDKNSDFYKAWSQDDIYENRYHVRLQDLSEGITLPFSETDFIDYQDFARELYHQNQRSQVGDEVTNATVNFAIYAPGGDLVKEGVGYHIGEESKPISQLLGLGYRRLTGYQELAQLDDQVLSQLESQTLNQTIAEDIAESVPISRETRQEVTASHNEAKTITSEREVLKNRFQCRVEEILNESPVQNQVNHRTGDIIINNSTVASNNSMIINSGIMSNRQTDTSTIHKTASSPSPKNSSESVDYQKVSAYELIQAAFQKIREYTQSPKDLAEYLDFMSKFPTLSPRNVALIQAQWPGANAVATYNQWQAMADSLGLSKDDVMQTKATYTNKRTGQTKEVVHNSLSVKAGEKSHIRLFRPQIEKMIPVLDNNGNQLKNEKGNPKFKRLSQATPQEKALVKEKKLKVSLFQKRDASGQPLYTTYNVFELSQTTLKPESYPKAMPNRHYNFDTDQVKTNEVLEGLCDYAKSIGVSILSDDAHTLGNIKGAFDPNRQEILLNPHNTPGEKIGTTIHELAHATLHNPKKMMSQTKTVPRYQAELEAEMTSYLVSKHFGLDTGDKAFRYMANWTDNLTIFSDKALTDSMTRIHKTVMSMVKHVEHHTKPYQRNHGQQPNFPKAQDKGLNR